MPKNTPERQIPTKFSVNHFGMYVLSDLKYQSLLIVKVISKK